jgi:uncharacterized membrane protein YdjX (TVP38/TMEM64 family)
MQQAMKNDGLKVLFLVRMTPIIPYGILNYLMGVTEIKTSHFLIANLGLLPGIMTQVFGGTTVATLTEMIMLEGGKTEENESVNLSYIVSVVASIFSILGFCFVTYKIRKILKKDFNIKTAAPGATELHRNKVSVTNSETRNEE